MTELDQLREMLENSDPNIIDAHSAEPALLALLEVLESTRWLNNDQRRALDAFYKAMLGED